MRAGRRFPLVALALLAACAAPPASTPPATVPPAPVLPRIDYPRAMQDVNPDPHVVEVNLEARVATVELEAGHPIQAWTYDGGTPGPLLQAFVGDRIIVHFTNNLAEPTTVHWHGLRISDRMDGVPTIQKPVLPGETFTYDFVAPDAGSFWYHPHMRSAEQVERGLYGPIVISEAPAKAPDFDVDRYFVVDDIRLASDHSIAPLGNDHMDQMDGRYGNTLLANGTAAPLPATFLANVVERWRLVNTANARTFLFTVTGATWRVVGVDGGLLPKPIEGLTHFELPVGARVELEVRYTAPTAKLVAHFPYTDANGVVKDDVAPMVVLTEAGAIAADGERAITYPEVVLPELPAPTASKTLVLNGYEQGTKLVFTINGKAFPDMEDWKAAANTPTRIVVRNDLMMIEHPFHLHGNFFRIVSRGGKPVDEPGLRDTVLIAPMEEVVLQTGFENPGEWMFHCHIPEHSEAGMMGMVHVGTMGM
jgi:FtsP/CotA-like multicopper oxidase with cupredoxin domain